MSPPITTRRAWIAGLLSMIPAARAAAVLGSAADDSRTDTRFAEIERRIGGRLGVSILDTGSGRRIVYRGSERFALCSTFKLLAAAAVLARVDAGQERLERRIPYTSSDLLDYAPITKPHAAEGGMALADLLAAAVEYSDNTAANLVLAALGGPPAVTRYVRSLGDATTRLDRNEPALNVVVRGDERDTTSPDAMVADMKALLVDHPALSAPSRERLTNWLIGCTTGRERLRAGLPSDWRAGDKTGSGPNGEANDVAIVWPPNRRPILIAAYANARPSVAANDQNRALADVARIASAQFDR